MNRNELCKLQVQKAKSKVKQLPFNTFLREVREAYGVSKQRVAFEANVDYQHLVLMELGRFYSLPKDEELGNLARYYDVDKNLLTELAINFLDKGLFKVPYACRNLSARALNRCVDGFEGEGFDVMVTQ